MVLYYRELGYSCFSYVTSACRISVLLALQRHQDLDDPYQLEIPLLVEVKQKWSIVPSITYRLNWQSKPAKITEYCLQGTHQPVIQLSWTHVLSTQRVKRTICKQQNDIYYVDWNLSSKSKHFTLSEQWQTSRTQRQCSLVTSEHGSVNQELLLWQNHTDL